MSFIAKASMACLFNLLFTFAVSAAVFTVNTINDTADIAPGNGICADASSKCSLRAAITEANALAAATTTITPPAGTFTQTLVAPNENLNAGGDWDITSTIKINGAGETTTFVQAAATSGTATERVLNVRPSGNLTLSGVTVRHGRFNGSVSSTKRGAGIENLGRLTLLHVIVRDNRIDASAGAATAAGIYHASILPLTLTDSSVTFNYSYSNDTVSEALGGGLTSFGTATLKFTRVNVYGNTAFGSIARGAGMYVSGSVNVTATDSHFDGNSGNGDNASTGAGAFVFANGMPSVFNATGCTFSNNYANGTSTGTLHYGAGVMFMTSNATLNATLDKVTIDNNNTSGSVFPFSYGSGLNATVNSGSMTLNILNSTISNNQPFLSGSYHYGGGMYITNDTTTPAVAGYATVNVTNSTISGNNASPRGGGIWMGRPDPGAVTVNLFYSTVANNRVFTHISSGEGGAGIFVDGGTLNLKSSMVADNSGQMGSMLYDEEGNEIWGTANSQDYNHIEKLDAWVTFTGVTTHNTIGDPLLGPLQNNGGTTWTHLPGAGSPVENAIPPGINECGTSVTTDQRSVTRPQNTGCEKGSVEM